MAKYFLSIFVLQTVFASGESGGSISRDEYISQVAQDIQNKLPKVFDMDVIRKKFGVDISPTSVVLLQELERFNKLVVRMQRSLAELQRVRRNDTMGSVSLCFRQVWNRSNPLVSRRLWLEKWV